MTNRRKEDERAHREGARGSSAAKAFGDRLAARALELGHGQGAWPDPRWQKDPVGFCRTFLGLELWEKQIAIAESVRDNDRTAVTSNQKSGKTRLAAALAIWVYSSWKGARVIMTSPKLEQVEEALWREVRLLWAMSGRCLACTRENPHGPRPCPHSRMLEGKLGKMPRTGLESHDLRQVLGYTAQEAEGIGGLSSPVLFIIIDEASGVERFVFESLDGNLGSATTFGRLLLISNPTQSDGPFFEAFHERKHAYSRIYVSAFDSPNVKAGREVIPGLADTGWIARMTELYGVDSPFFRVRVEGKFLLREQGKVLSLHQILEACKRWPTTPASGRLCIGVDVAGQSGAGDESVFVARRGQKVIDMRAMRGLTDQAHAVNLEGMLRELRGEREEGPPLIAIDRTGPIGAGVWGAIRAWAQHPDREDLVVMAVNMSDKARHLQGYDRVRDELWAAGAAWIREGGAIPDDPKLTAELHAPEWIQIPAGRDKVTASDELRRRLQRSPDRATAFLLSVWAELGRERRVSDSRDETEPGEGAAGETHDPYAGLDWLDPRKKSGTEDE